jgi:hypothetical protein
MMSILILAIMLGAGVLLVAVIMSGNSSKAKRKGKNKSSASDTLRVPDDVNINPMHRMMLDRAFANPAIAEWVTQTGLQLLNEQTGITTKLYAGQFDEAVRAYQAHMNVDQFTARDAVTEIARMLKLPVTTRLEDGEIVPDMEIDDVQPKRKTEAMD